MRVLFALASTNQMYSGVGRAIRELTARLADRVRFEFAIDDCNPKNVAILKDFCVGRGIDVHVGRASRIAEYCDPVNEGLADLLSERRWDAIEVVGWANPGTHATVLDGVADTVLCYTPHLQPLWTVNIPEDQARMVAAVHQRLLQRADVVLCDSPAERLELQACVPDSINCAFLPLGCDFDGFEAGPWQRKPQLLFVGDLNEPRKRFDRVLAVFSRLLRQWPSFRLVVIGNRSDQFRDHLPPEVRPSCELRGYVSEPELRRTYAESRGLFLLSDYEAFGLPILEAMVSGTPVFLSKQDVTQSLFGRFRGANFCPADDPDGTAAIVSRNLSRGLEAVAEVIEERDRLKAAFDWEPLADQKWQALASAWFQKNLMSQAA